MKAIVKIDVPEEYVGKEVSFWIPEILQDNTSPSHTKLIFKGKIEEDKNIAHWNCLDNYGGQVNGFECSKCKMPSKEDTEFCSSCGRWMAEDK